MRYELVVQCNKCGSTERFFIPPTDNNLFCSRCKAKFDHLAVEPVKGFLYILSNPSMPGLLKIGMTEGDVSDRITQLSSGTGVAEPFVLEASITSTDPLRDERLVHERLAPYRKPKREFFELSVPDAVATLQQVLSRVPTYVRSDSLLQVTEKSQFTAADHDSDREREFESPLERIRRFGPAPKYQYTCPDCGTIFWGHSSSPRVCSKCRRRKTGRTK